MALCRLSVFWGNFVEKENEVFVKSGAKRQESLPESGGLLVFWRKYCIMISE